MLTTEQKAMLLEEAGIQAAIPPVEDSDVVPQPPGEVTNEPPIDAEEEADQAKDEQIKTLEERIDRLEQDMARVLAVTNPELEEI